MKRIRTIILCILCLLLAAVIPQTQAETEQAENLTAQCAFTFEGYPYAAERVLLNPNHYQIFEAQASFFLTAEQPLRNARLCIQWRVLPTDVRILQDDASGALLSEELLPSYPETVTPISEHAHRVTVQAGDAEMQICRCAVYGPGELPDPFHDWQETPQKLDYLLISTHPDDDVLFLGSVIPTYGAEQGYVGTIIYVTCINRERMTEAENGAWTMGLRYRPLFFGMPDVPKDAPQEKKDTFSYDELLLLTVRAYRAYHPVTVFAQDVNGEYGHWQHKLTSRAAREAFALASDPGYDPASAEEYGTWQVQKLFLHLYPENTVRIDAHTPLAFFDGLDAYTVACRAFLKHESQIKTGFRVRCDDDKYAFNCFGMAEGTVPLGEDVFDNIDASLLSAYVPPTPEPTEIPTAEPTPEPTDEPTAEPTNALTPVTAEPLETPSAQTTPEPAATTPNRMLLPGIGVCAVICAALVLIAFRKRKKD